MRNPPGIPIWYELITSDAEGAKTFYDHVVGWTIQPPPPGPVDYRMIGAGEGFVGGVFKMDADMQAAGMRPAWIPYFGVEDVDATAARATELGAKIFVPPSDIPNVGRFSFMADPQGALFYIMRGATDQASTVFSRGQMERCGWNELWTNDIEKALPFYATLLGIENRETMDMGPMGGYHFLDVGDTRIGAAAQMKDQPPQWNLYFTVPAIGAAIERVKAKGGTITMGPHPVPTGEFIVLGIDPQGAAFALVAPEA